LHDFVIKNVEMKSVKGGENGEKILSPTVFSFQWKYFIFSCLKFKRVVDTVEFLA